MAVGMVVSLTLSYAMLKTEIEVAKTMPKPIVSQDDTRVVNQKLDFLIKEFEKFELGGLSGKPIETKSVQIIKFLAKLTDYKFPIIGVGGVSNTDSAIRKLDAGACLLQIYSSLVYQGPSFPSQLANSLSHRARKWN